MHLKRYKYKVNLLKIIYIVKNIYIYIIKKCIIIKKIIYIKVILKKLRFIEYS